MTRVSVKKCLLPFCSSRLAVTSRGALPDTVALLGIILADTGLLDRCPRFRAIPSMD
jgi:hypothetical protein